MFSIKNLLITGSLFLVVFSNVFQSAASTPVKGAGDMTIQIIKTTILNYASQVQDFEDKQVINYKKQKKEIDSQLSQIGKLINDIEKVTKKNTVQNKEEYSFMRTKAIQLWDKFSIWKRYLKIDKAAHKGMEADSYMAYRNERRKCKKLIKYTVKMEALMDLPIKTWDGSYLTYNMYVKKNEESCVVVML